MKYSVSYKQEYPQKLTFKINEKNKTKILYQDVKVSGSIKKNEVNNVKN